MPSRWDAATCDWRRRIFHYPPPTLMSGNFWLPCTIELRPLSLTPLKMRKVEQRERPGQHDEIMPHHGLQARTRHTEWRNCSATVFDVKRK